MVYCLEVPSHIFYVRKNGKGSWTGNSSRHGQKGVVGMILPAESMPFTRDGIVPDIIMNCHACPSRMTIGQLLESLLGKVSCMAGKIADGTPFRGVTPENINLAAKAYDIGKMGKEVMFNGKTGEMLKQPVFIGLTYYQRLRHMVQDKIHARAKGPMQILTRQPVEGRSRKGGFRMGEMERDALIAHGGERIIRDRFLDQSDRYETWVCRTCGNLAENPTESGVLNVTHKRAYCRFCNNSDATCKIVLPYSMKLLIQELHGIHISIKLTTA
jgi:DNA-directed RNA polymerase beta subunit